MRRALFALVLIACGTAPPHIETAEVVPTISEEDLSEGSCGGFTDIVEGESFAMLAGRLSLRAPAGTQNMPRSHDIMGAPPAEEMESRLFLEHADGARFVVFATELLRTPTDDLVAAARADIGEGYRVAALEVAAPLRAAIAIPRELDTSDEAVDVAMVYTVTEDQLVQRVEFYVTEDAANDGGCERLALGYARTLEAGGRSLPDEPGPRVLEGTFGIDLPSGYRLLVEEGPDFSVYRVSATLPLGHGVGALGIYIGHHPSMEPREGATTTPGTIAGHAVEWSDATEDGVRHRQTLVQLTQHEFAHVFFTSDEPRVFDRLQSIAESLREGVRPPPLAACSPSHLPAVEVEAEVLAIPELQTLLHAEEFSEYRRTWDVPHVESTNAYLSLSTHPRAREAFLYLAVHGTTAGKIYGLLGLYHHDRDRFEEVVCAVASILDPQVVVRRSCGTEAVSVPELVERTNGARGQRHFTASQWRAALREAPADIRGGGLAWEIALGPRDLFEVTNGTWELGGDGWVPPIMASDHAAAEMPAFAPADHTTQMSLTSYGGVCRTRADGRVACWGITPATELSHARRLPEWVRWPRQIALDLGLGCVLDANGRRACFGEIQESLAARATACSSSEAPRGVAIRRFDDGPWRALYSGGDLCGVTLDGALRCFRWSRMYAPEWAEVDGIGIGASYPVPVEGEVLGVAPAYLGGSVAWTADGTIWTWSNYDPPAIAGRVEGVVEVIGGNDREWLFARTGDGRVFVRGVRPGVQYWSSFAADDGPFVEVPELRGARVWLGDHHACSLIDGTVRCWGQSAGYLPERQDEYDTPPTEVATLRGARSLWLGEWMTCGDMPNGSWRCIGSHQASLSNRPDVPEERRAPYDVRLDRIAASIQ